MLEKKHNEYSKQFMQKILLFIDTILINTANADADTNKILVSGILNIRDAIFSDIIKDNLINTLNEQTQQENNKKKENEKNLNQETELVNDQED
tara:strand:+ start:869 stop:1150 length:282 start_codon:yes stop_codon:yes gene_type:complete